MSTITAYAPGTFCWPELATSDQAGARKFYTALFGWTADDTPMGEGETYTMLYKDGRNVGAMYRKRPEEPVPNWHAYVSVANADEAAAKAKQLGGKVLTEPFDVMEHGRMATIQDPTGAIFNLWQTKSHKGADLLDEPGALVWTELLTRDPAAARPFYTQLFGWKPNDMDMGEGGTYTVFERDAKKGAGGMMTMPKQMPAQVPSHWLPYFHVLDCDATAAKTTELGGKVMMPPTDIPNVGRFATLADPQGAVFQVLKPIPM